MDFPFRCQDWYKLGKNGVIIKGELIRSAGFWPFRRFNRKSRRLITGGFAIYI
jgi:hypothetical protein